MKNITINIHPLAALLAVVAALAVSCQDPGEPAEELWEYEIGLENSGRLAKAWTFMSEHIPAYGGPRPQVSDLPALMLPSPIAPGGGQRKTSQREQLLNWSGVDETPVSELIDILRRRIEGRWEYAGQILCPAAESGSAYYVLWKRKRFD